MVLEGSTVRLQFPTVKSDANATPHGRRILSHHTSYTLFFCCHIQPEFSPICDEPNSIRLLLPPQSLLPGRFLFLQRR